MKTLVLGGGGMLGHKVVQRLSSRTTDLWWTLRGSTEDAAIKPVPLLASDHAITGTDATDWNRFVGMLEELRPSVVINCLGVIRHRAEGTDARLCQVLNAELPHRVAETIAQWNGRLVQISTDCVFSGSRGNYTEDDVPDADDVYGRSKADGEVVAENTVVLRTSFIGRELRYHHSLLDWFLTQEGKTVRGYRRAFWSGITTLELAKAIDHILVQPRALSGIYHISGEAVSKFDLLRRLRAIYGVQVNIDPDDAVRRDLRLDGKRFVEATGYRCAPLNQQLTELIRDPTPYRSVSSDVGVRSSREVRIRPSRRGD